MKALLIFALIVSGILLLILPPLGLWLLLVLINVFWIWMLVDAILNRGLGDVEKICWVLVVFFFNIVGSLVYFFVARPKGKGAVAN